MRNITELNGCWEITEEDSLFPDSSGLTQWQSIHVPGVWNMNDPAQASQRIYRHRFNLAEKPEDAHFFLRFEAVGGLCRPVLNGFPLGEHKGGYSAFAFDITEAIKAGENTLYVWTDNTRYGDIIPLMGDFNNYGGIYRPVTLIGTGRAFFDPLFYGTCGLELDTDPDGSIHLIAHVGGKKSGISVRFAVHDMDGNVTADTSGKPEERIIIRISNPHLWNGCPDPYLYSVTASILEGDQCLDTVTLNCGFRSIRVDPDEGFFLNGEYLRLNGVAKHQDRAGYACAVPDALIDEDMELIREIGANSVRLSHYQHPQHTYDCCDRYGFVVWAEIPLLNAPDGNDALMENAAQQLTELIYQNKHHPSVCFWGVQNEVALSWESPEVHAKIRKMNELAKSLDPRRFTASANDHNADGVSPLNSITQVTGQNRYYGWYYGELGELGEELDHLHQTHPDMPFGVTEYGVDAWEGYHTSSPRRRDYSEEYQSLFHEMTYQEILDRKWVWGSYVWNMFDFGSARRQEGGLSGLNRKGLVTFDRQLKKDAFYFYKACWSKESFVYITSRRFTNRSVGNIKIRVYTNITSGVALSVNGVVIGTAYGTPTVEFDHVPIRPGENEILAAAEGCTDRVVWIGCEKENTDCAFVDPNPGFHVKDWYTPEEGKDELFPKDRYTIMDNIGDLMANSEVWAVVEEMAPQIIRNDRVMSMPRMQLLRAINFISSQFEEEHVKELNRKLRQFRKPVTE